MLGTSDGLGEQPVPIRAITDRRLATSGGMLARRRPAVGESVRMGESSVAAPA